MMPKRPSYGEPEPLGVIARGDAVNVAVFSANASAIEFCLFDAEREVRRVRLRGRTGHVFHDRISGVPPGARYGLRAHGPWLPREGHYFNPAKLLIDPYASVIDRPLALHASMFGYRAGDPLDAPRQDDKDSAPYVPKGIVSGPDTLPRSASPMTTWPRTVIYELHVRGFTARRLDIPEPSRGRFAGLAHPAAIDHLVRLGVTTVEIMPAAAWIEERHLAARGLRNYWGYNPVAFMAPDPGLAPGGWDEIRLAVDALAAAGIETILDIVLNHSGEGDVLGPTLSLRGLDNATYYRSLPGTPWRYADDAGCGNALALDRPAPLRLAMDTLRLWAMRAGVHGFRFDLATTLGRREDGFDPAAPLLSAIAQDPSLRNLKLIAEPWDVGSNGYRIGAFPATWGEWNDRFRDGVRRFWRGDPGQLGEFATRIAGSSDLFAARGVASRSINYVVAHDGFTLADLVSFTRKVNDANGEQNSDGTDANFAWNNGVEGPGTDPIITAARRRDQHALLATLILARGTPMLTMGSELGHSQGGNNNAYAQDNPASWLDWDTADHDLIAWTRHLLRIRRDHALLRGDCFLTGAPTDISLLPDVEWRDASGQIMTPEAWQSPQADTLVMTLAGAAEGEDATSRIIVILHRGRSDVAVVLPPPRAGHGWRLVADSTKTMNAMAQMAAFHDPLVTSSPPIPMSGGDRSGGRGDNWRAAPLLTEGIFTTAARGVIVLVEQPREPRTRIAADAPLLDRLASAAGIAPEWWDVSGRRTIVSDDTRLALLKAMRFPATTEGEARDSLRRLSREGDRRALPHALVLRRDEPAIVPLEIEPGLGRRPLWLVVEQEDGESRHIRYGMEDGNLRDFTGSDGLPARQRLVDLPMLPEGRHRIWREDAPDTVCHLTVAPRRCFLFDAISGGAKRFGIAAQLYALRRHGDQGIGDFTTLAMLAAAAGQERAATVGINPLHMMFPDQRERASPYHPSDRRFLDPIYLDIANNGANPGVEAMRPLGRNETVHSGFARANDQVAYTEVWTAKLAALECQFSEFTASERTDPSIAAGFQRFIHDSGPDLQRFATFQAISETRPGEAWHRWPEGLRSPVTKATESFAMAHAERVRFHQYLQFLADRQFSAAAATASSSGLELGLFRDLAVGAAPDGAESWARSEDLAKGAWIGAPPDPFAAGGQNWYLPPPLPLQFQNNGYASFAALIAANMRHAGVLRIDHAMGLSRLFWIPDGGAGADGAYVTYPFADLVGQVALESTRARCMVVGEDLGTVPDGFRDVMTEANILSYRVLLLEREGRRFRPAASYPARAVACVTTHDLPPLAGWWEGADLQERSALGLLPIDVDADETREAERVALTEALVEEGCLAPPETGPPPIEAIIEGVHEFIASTPADLMLIQVEELADMRVGVNLPGTNTERPNWRLRVPVPVETLLTSPEARKILKSVRARNRGTADNP